MRSRNSAGGSGSPPNFAGGAGRERPSCLSRPMKSFGTYRCSRNSSLRSASSASTPANSFVCAIAPPRRRSLLFESRSQAGQAKLVVPTPGVGDSFSARRRRRAYAGPMQVDPRAPELVSGDFVAMMHASRMCVLVHDAGTKRILWANPAASELLGWSVSELRPLKANDMSSSAQQYDRVIGRALLQEAVEKGTCRYEWHYRSRSGRVIPTDVHAVRVELAQGPAVMVQFRDIEREQEIEQRLRLTTSY